MPRLTSPTDRPMQLVSSLFTALLLGALTLPADAAQEEGIVLRAGQMIDVIGGRSIPNAVVRIRGEHIVALGGSDIPEGARVVDLGGMTLLPGFMDLHTHLGVEIDAASFTRPVRDTEADAAMIAVKNARITLLAGFTTVRDFGSGIDVALMKAVEAGTVLGPMVVPSRFPLGITGGHCDATGFAPGILERDWRTGTADGVDEIVKAVRYQIKHGAKVIKTCATAGVLSFEEQVGAQQYSYEELSAMVDEAERHGIKVAAHAHGADGIKAAVRAGVASIEHGSILDDEAIKLMRQYGTYLVPTTYLTAAIDLEALPPLIRNKAETILPIARDSLRRAIRAGVKIAFGTDAAVFPHGDNAREFAALVDRGMSPLEAIRAATIYAADLLGVDNRGSIRVGQLANLVAVEGNPLEDITATERVRFVMQGGTIYKLPETP